jgi:indole-3-glycerol phosphate synthase
MKSEKDLDFIQDLLEKYDFDELPPFTKEKVLTILNEKEYTAERQTILASVALFSEANIHQPKPLVIVKEKHFLASPVPLYQALIGIAAAVLLMMFIFPSQKLEVSEQIIKYVTLYDTIETEILRYDTIEKIIEKPIVKEKIVFVNNMDLKEAPRLFDVPRNNATMNFSKETIQNRGVSMKDDTILFTLPELF